jgi:hypothetical protein
MEKPIDFKNEVQRRRSKSCLVPLRFHPRLSWDPRQLRQMASIADKKALERAKLAKPETTTDPDPAA